jgi:DNA polymerase I-like protein with 3'-5' exonuclease and polymerase domains
MKLIKDMTPTPDNQEIIYNALDTMQTVALKQLFDSIMPEWASIGYTYNEKMLGPVMAMMRRGIKIDLARRDIEVAAMEGRLETVAANFQRLCEGTIGTDINYNSSPQRKFLFYEALAIPEMHKFVKGEAKVSADRKALERIVKEFTRGVPFANFLLCIADLESQIEFLTKGLSPDGRFHASYNIAGTETFRFSSSEHPLRIGGNGQNVPPHARACFEADEGYTFFQADQQGAEARLVAYLSGDENYIAACEGGDAHTMVASMVFGFEPIRELAEQEYYRGKSYRQVCKSGSHGSNYYGKPFTLAQQMGVETDIAEQFQNKYFKRFPGIPDWHNAIAKQLQETGIITTPFGLRRTFWGRRFDDATLREAIAFVPQSTVGVLTNIGLHNLWAKYEGGSSPDVMILANGHDAVIGQIKTEKLDALVPEVLDVLRFPFYIEDVKGKTRECVIPFDMEVGNNWGKYDPEKNPKGLKKWKPNSAA